jgi:hypothetical protein
MAQVNECPKSVNYHTKLIYTLRLQKVTFSEHFFLQIKSIDFYLFYQLSIIDMD